MKILVIEDDQTVQTLIKIVLENKDHEVILADTAAKGKLLAVDDAFDMIILDLGLPDGDGFEICKLTRKENLTTPILVLSAAHETNIKVKCLEVGADDYLTKPFETSELTARINAISRRSGNYEGAKECLSCGNLELNLVKRSCSLGGNDIELTNNEFDLLAFLMENEGKTVTKNEISQHVWDIKFDTQTNYINVYVSYLRKKIREHSDHQYIQTIRNKGFELAAPYR